MDLVKRWRNHGPLVKGGRKLIAFVNLFAGNSAVGVYEFAEGYGEFTGRTENPSTAYAVPFPLTWETLLRRLQAQCVYLTRYIMSWYVHLVKK